MNIPSLDAGELPVLAMLDGSCERRHADAEATLPSSRGMSECWVSKEVFDRLNSAPNSKAARRRYLGVWQD